jgi:pimeloyl-ACP methyl ester carboxylesterase
VRIHVGETDVAYDEAGSGEPVVLVHPASLSREVWERNVHALATRFRVIAADWPGHGDTAGDTTELVAFGEALCDALGVEAAHWIGASWGGGIAIRMAALTHRVRRMVLVGTGGVPTSEIARHVSSRSKDESPWELFRGTYQDATYATRERFERVTALQKRAMPYMVKFRSSLPADYAERGLAPEMQVVKAPTLVIWGAHDRVFPVAIAPFVVRSIDGSRLVVYDKSNHFPFVDEAARFNEDVARFLAS